MPDNHLEQLRDITLSAAERDAMRGRLRAYAAANPPVPSFPVRVWGWTLRHSTVALGLAFILIAGGTGVSAERAHPGDFLYGFRLSVNDRIETALAFSDDAQIDVEMEQLQRLLDDEDAVRDREFSRLAFNDAAEDDDELTAEIEAIERELADGDDNPSDSSGEDEQFDDAGFEEELRSIERELEAEEQMELD